MFIHVLHTYTHPYLNIYIHTSYTYLCYMLILFLQLAYTLRCIFHVNSFIQKFSLDMKNIIFIMLATYNTYIINIIFHKIPATVVSKLLLISVTIIHVVLEAIVGDVASWLE